ncbi:hypothetical protein FB45DRAFT_866800 [Roridomyces roridus]|uniref:Uncharacterized protein n=1 Tax=Roridomyces roridus TaxID=1738132 RepID=A0AAD7FKQ1_9AGAR|nr:hypothetical protein FB45DRAFT_866800 [Roridomyces roridus]
MGHAAINQFDRGYQRLEDGKLAEYLKNGAEYAQLLLHEMEYGTYTVKILLEHIWIACSYGNPVLECNFRWKYQIYYLNAKLMWNKAETQSIFRDPNVPQDRNLKMVPKIRNYDSVATQTQSSKRMFPQQLFYNISPIRLLHLLLRAIAGAWQSESPDVKNDPVFSSQATREDGYKSSIFTVRLPKSRSNKASPKSAASSVDAKLMCRGGKQEAVPINGAENGTVIGCQTDLWSRSASDSPSAEMLTTRRPLEAGRSEQERR